MLVTSIVVLVGMPTLGLIIEAAVPDGAAHAIIREWGAAGAMLLVCLAFCWHLLRRNEELANRLFEVIQKNTEALTGNQEVLKDMRSIVANCEVANSDPHDRRRSRGGD